MDSAIAGQVVRDSVLVVIDARECEILSSSIRMLLGRSVDIRPLGASRQGGFTIAALEANRLTAYRSGNIVDFLKLTVGIDVAISTLNVSVNVPIFHPEGSIRIFVAESVGSIIVQLIHLSKDFC